MLCALTQCVNDPIIGSFNKRLLSSCFREGNEDMNTSKLKHLVMVNNFLLANRTQAPFEILNEIIKKMLYQSLICFSFVRESFFG